TAAVASVRRPGVEIAREFGTAREQQHAENGGGCGPARALLPRSNQAESIRSPIHGAESWAYASRSSRAGAATNKNNGLRGNFETHPQIRCRKTPESGVSAIPI